MLPNMIFNLPEGFKSLDATSMAKYTSRTTKRP